MSTTNDKSDKVLSKAATNGQGCQEQASFRAREQLTIDNNEEHLGRQPRRSGWRQAWKQVWCHLAIVRCAPKDREQNEVASARDDTTYDQDQVTNRVAETVKEENDDLVWRVMVILWS